jgi:hypothetical protein
MEHVDNDEHYKYNEIDGIIGLMEELPFSLNKKKKLPTSYIT